MNGNYYGGNKGWSVGPNAGESHSHCAVLNERTNNTKSQKKEKLHDVSHSERLKTISCRDV